ncbi:hypothetical protein [Arthrobacter sp. 31Y]|uniref:hypothetical protein n=1 Tax=Arthrobacter sp. 31Y TaxID=1115632 RepID=UPI0004634844|nr:hypothetical protein [Arthrobacter sp. 31Y]
MTHSFAADHATPHSEKQQGIRVENQSEIRWGDPSEPSPRCRTERHPERRAERSAAGAALGSFGVVAVVGVFALLLHMLAQHSPRVGPGYAGWAQETADNPLTALRWFLGDMTEPLFYKSDLAALGLLAGAAAAWWVGRRGGRWAGTLSNNSGLWPWVLASASLSLMLSNLVFGWVLDDGWQPTFVPFVCVAPAMVFLYGAGWRTCITGAVLGAATTTPLALLFIHTVSEPLGLPPVVASVLAMSVGSAISFLIARRLPWLVLREAREARPATQAERPPSNPNRNVAADAAWAARRVLKDFTETHFFANELAGACLILAVAAAFVLNPGLPSYGTGLLPHILFAQALTSAIGVTLWRGWYRDGGWAATYASVVSVAPAAVLAYEGSWQGMVGGAVMGAVLAPPLARAISARLPVGFHPVIGNTAAMAISTAVALPVLRLLP